MACFALGKHFFHLTFTLPQDLFCTKTFNSAPITVLSHLNFATFSAVSSMASSGNNAWMPSLLLLLTTMLSSAWTSALFSPHHTVTFLHFSPHSLLCCFACILTKAVRVTKQLKEPGQGAPGQNLSLSALTCHLRMSCLVTSTL